MITKPVVGDIIKCDRFARGYIRHDGRLLVGCNSALSKRTDKSRGQDRFLVVHSDYENTGGPGTTTELTALRINSEAMTLGEEIVLEVEAVCHELIMPEKITCDGHYDKVPFYANAALIVRADSKDAAAKLAVNLLGFFPIEEPTKSDGDTWKIVGHSYRPTPKNDAIIGVCELVTAESEVPVDLKK